MEYEAATRLTDVFSGRSSAASLCAQQRGSTEQDFQAWATGFELQLHNL